MIKHVNTCTIYTKLYQASNEQAVIVCIIILSLELALLGHLQLSYVVLEARQTQKAFVQQQIATP